MIHVLKGQIKAFKKNNTENPQPSGFCPGKFFLSFNVLKCPLSQTLSNREQDGHRPCPHRVYTREGNINIRKILTSAIGVKKREVHFDMRILQVTSSRSSWGCRSPAET